MTVPTQGQVVGVAKGVLSAAAMLALVYFGIMIGENQRQISTNTTAVQTLNVALAAEINRATSTDVSLSNAQVLISSQLTEILHRLDRIEAKRP